MNLSGKTVVVTGAGSGVGLAAVKLFVEQGCQVAATARQAGQLTMLAALGEKVLPLDLDVTSPEQWERTVDAITARWGGVDVLFNNAGATIRGSILETDLALWNQTLTTNLTSVFLGCKTVIPSMLERGGGAIINHASINALQGNTNLVAYCASKGGVTAMTRALALDYAASSIRVNCICSAAIDTAMTRNYLETVEDERAVMDAITAKHPIGRMATADEVAQVALFLASPLSSYMTGTSIPVDGGRSVR